MRKPIPALAALLSVQVLLAAGLALAGPRLSAGPGETRLLTVDTAAIDRIAIDGPGQPGVVLARAAGGWQLPALGDFPTEAGKVDRLLSRIAALQHGDPVATSAAAAERFKVARGAFERRIALEANGKAVATLYLGSSAALRSVHARVGGKSDVYLVELPAWEVPATGDEWADRSVLHVPKAEIEAIDAGGVRLERVAAASTPAAPAPSAAGAPPAAPARPPAPAWRATGLPAGATLDAAAADRLAGLVADLTVAGVLGREAKPEWGLDRPALVLSVSRAGKDRVEYRFARMPDGQSYVVKASSRPEHFRLSKASAEEIVKAASRETLSGKPPAAAKAAVKAPAKATAKR